MLIYYDGKFCSSGFAFAVPNGYMINTEPDEGFPCGFGAWTPDGECYVEWEIESGCKGTLAELQELFSPGLGMFPITSISPILINGLQGHHVAYSYKRGQRYEIRLLAEGGCEISFRVEPLNSDVLTAIKKPAIQAAIKEIWPCRN